MFPPPRAQVTLRGRHGRREGLLWSASDDSRRWVSRAITAPLRPSGPSGATRCAPAWAPRGLPPMPAGCPAGLPAPARRIRDTYITHTCVSQHWSQYHVSSRVLLHWCWYRSIVNIYSIICRGEGGKRGAEEAGLARNPSHDWPVNHGVAQIQVMCGWVG